MKKAIHPTYQKVLFIDSASGYRFICGTTLKPDATEKFEGVDYPVSYLSISSSSHPFFTGSKQLVDSEGRVEKFKKRFGRKDASQDESSSQNESASQQEKKSESVVASAKKPVEATKHVEVKKSAEAKKPDAKKAVEAKKPEKKTGKPAKKG